MPRINRRTFAKGALAASATVGAPAVLAYGAENPIRIGFSIAQTGGIAAGGKSGLTALELWRSDVNAAGGLLGRPVEFVVYDDQSQPNLVPGIYAKLIDIDKVDLLLAPYGTNLAAVVMPMIKQRDRFVLGQFEIGQNDNLGHDKFFSRLRRGVRSPVPIGAAVISTWPSVRVIRRWRSSVPTPSSRRMPPMRARASPANTA